MQRAGINASVVALIVMFALWQPLGGVADSRAVVGYGRTDRGFRPFL